MKKTTVTSIYTKAQQEVLDALNGGKPLPKPGKSRHGNLGRYKRHEDAFAELRKLGVIAKDQNNVLYVVKSNRDSGPLFTKEELTNMAHAVYAYADSHYRFEPVFNTYTALYRKLKILAQ